MANTAQAKKRAKQAEKRRIRNISRKTEMRTYIKNVLKAIQAKDKNAAMAAFRIATAMLDKCAGSGLIHKNKADRHKSRLNAHIKAI